MKDITLNRALKNFMLGGYIRKEVRVVHTAKSHEYKQALSSHKGYWYFSEAVIKIMCVECRIYFCGMWGRGRKRKG